MRKTYITYYSKSDGKKVKRPYNPHHEMQHEFIAKTTVTQKVYDLLR